MPRQNLSDLLGNLGQPAPVAPVNTEPALISPGSSVANVPPPAPPGLTSPARVVRSEPIDATAPAYLTLVRKETRLREDQQNMLTLHARRLNRVKSHGSPRITDNSLIRISVDLLLARIEDASGGDEASILKSLNR